MLDYDDLLLYFAQMLTEPAIAADVAAASIICWSTNTRTPTACRPRSCWRCGREGRGLTVVGDDAQSIYSFRAATVRNILEFPQSFSPPARVVTLERNYRSTQAILAAANAVIALAPERFPKNLWSERENGAPPELASVAEEADQARFVALRVLENREAGASLKSQAVLFRAAHHSAALELELTRRNIPFVKFGGLKFLDAAHVKDTLALLRFAANPRDRIAGFRVAQLLPGIGPASAEKIVAAAAADDGFATLAALAGAGARARRLRRLRGADAAPRAGARPGRAILAKRSPGAATLAESYDDVAARAADLDALERIAVTFASRERFLAELTLDPPDATSDEVRAAVARRGLSHSLDHPFRQGAGMEVGVRAQLRRRLHPLRSGDRLVGGDRGGAPPALCRDDARARHADADRAAALLCAWPAEERRPPCLRRPHPLHSAVAGQAFRRQSWPLAPPKPAARPTGAEGRSRRADARDVEVGARRVW